MLIETRAAVIYLEGTFSPKRALTFLHHSPPNEVILGQVYNLFELLAQVKGALLRSYS